MAVNSDTLHKWIKRITLFSVLFLLMLIFSMSSASLDPAFAQEGEKGPDETPPVSFLQPQRLLGQTPSILLVSDENELDAIANLVDDLGFTRTSQNNNWTGSQGVYTSNLAYLQQFDVVIFYASGSSVGRLLTSAEFVALDSYVENGGRLLVTGYDTLGHPDDSRMASLVRSSTFGDGPFTTAYTIENEDHPIANGPFGTFSDGTALTAGFYDHDTAEADTDAGAVTVAELDGGRDKIIATEVGSNRGRVVYWNGNFEALDWAVLTVTDAGVRTLSDASLNARQAADAAPIEDKGVSPDDEELSGQDVAELQAQNTLLLNTLAWLGPDFPYEVNDSPGTCSDIEYGVNITDVFLNPAGDFDYYCLNGLVSQTIVADIDAQVSQFDPAISDSALDSVIDLFDANGNFLASSDDEDFPFNLDSKLVYTFPDNGTYLLRVRSFDHPCCGGTDHYYSMRVDIYPEIYDASFFDDYEPGPETGWTATGLWHLVEDGVDTYANSNSPSRAFWYGRNNTGNYATGSRTTGNLTSPIINLPDNDAPATLFFDSWYETEPLDNASSIYVDLGNTNHYGSNGIAGVGFLGSNSRFAALGQALLDAGNSITEGTVSLNTVSLNNYTTVVLPTSNVLLTQAEIDALTAFMNDGGRVVFIGERQNFPIRDDPPILPPGVVDVFNAFGPDYGLILNDDILEDPTDNTGQPFHNQIFNFANDALTQGIQELQLYASASITVDPDSLAEPLASGDDDTVVLTAATLNQSDVAHDQGGTADPFDASLPAVRSNSGQPSLSAQDIVPGAPIVAAYAPVGDGVLIVVGDANMWTRFDSDLTDNGVIDLYEADNLAFANLIMGSPPDDPDWDKKEVQIARVGDAFTTLGYITGGPQRTWERVSIPIPDQYLGDDILIRFKFDSRDRFSNDYRGWYVDNFGINVDPPSLEITNVTVSDDNIPNDNSNGDDDGLAEPGERIELIVDLQNNGGETAQNIEAKLSSTSEYVSDPLYNLDAEYGDITPGATASNPFAEDWDIDIDPDTPLGTIAEFVLDISGDNIPNQQLTFSIPIGETSEPPLPAIRSIIIDDNTDGDSNGNSDETINPGETIELRLIIRSLSDTSISNGRVCLEVDTTYVTGPNNGFDDNECASLVPIIITAVQPAIHPPFPTPIRLGIDDFEFPVAPDTPSGYAIPFTATITADNGGPWVETFTLPVVDGTLVRVVPAEQDVGFLGGFGMDIRADEVDNLGSFELELAYDPAVISPTHIIPGPFLGNINLSPAALQSQSSPGLLRVTGSGSGASPGLSGSGPLARVIFRSIMTEAGESDLILQNVKLFDTEGAPIDAVTANGQVTILSTIFADFNQDGSVTLNDIIAILNARIVFELTGDYDPRFDVDGDQDIDFVDVAVAGCYFDYPNNPCSPFGPLSASAQTDPVISIDPDRTDIETIGQTETITVTIDNADALNGFEFSLDYDPEVIEVTDVALGDFLPTATHQAGVDDANGTLTFSAVAVDGSTASGSGTLATLEVELRTESASILDLNNLKVVRTGAQVANATGVDGQVGAPGQFVFVPTDFIYLPLIQK